MKRFLGALALVSALAVPGLAHAASAIATADVNLRAGPSTGYPVVTVIGGGQNVEVNGCLQSYTWCDVTYRGARGWMSANYLAYLEGGRRYTDRVPARIGAPIITFSFGNYWDRHYRHYGFYRDRERYHRHWDRYDRRDDRRDWRDHRRSDRRDWRDDRRSDRRDWRDDRRSDRRDWRDDRRGDRRDLRGERSTEFPRWRPDGR
ncbi:SH3 domain-containing protein [Lutibaculum baratangense]|uniref:SH3b domain-containing protein n=1 Tax=Lutibaculum baratangense AMV1 TaxID=631454 RepID=V4RMQ9_9HYPH|nr:SH3 domain-containing protein [Lutibaculum baratangense]ESR27311.1 hypothetical protein N177_0290 [Lutibaculum baratangense AMV1]